MNQLRPFEMLTMEMSEKRISNGVIFSQYSTQNVATQKVACFFLKKSLAEIANERKIIKSNWRLHFMTLSLTSFWYLYCNHLNRFHTFFWCFHCWLWTSKCWLSNDVLSVLFTLSWFWVINPLFLPWNSKKYIYTFWQGLNCVQVP